MSAPTPILRQCSGIEQRECFCSDPVGADTEHDIRLACNCLIHRSCLVSYIRSQLGDRAALFASMQHAGQIGIICPYVRASQCYATNNKTFISIKEMEKLVSLQNNISSEALPEEHLIPDEISRLKRWIDEEEKLKNGSAESAAIPVDPIEEKKKQAAKVKADLQLTDVYIAATTKSCPSCQFRVTHWHGHSCHHIQPSGGCPKCRVPFCYKCLQSGPVNQRQRGNVNYCLCGGWSNFCATSNVAENLILEPYPYDKRCGCFICPDCSKGKPCETCNGHCVVCLGYIPPGPRELNSTWNASFKSNRSNAAPKRLDPVAELFAACQAADPDRIILILGGTNGPSVNVRDNLQRTPLFYAIDRSNVECVRLLLTVFGADPTVYDNSRNTPLHHAAEVNNIEIIQLLLTPPEGQGRGNSMTRVNVNAVNNQGVTALHVAVTHASLEMYRLLISYGARTNLPDAHGCTPLHMACNLGCEQISLHLICERNENVFAVDHQGKTPLHYAAQNESLTMVLQLIEKVSSSVSNVEKANKGSISTASAAAVADDKTSTLATPDATKKYILTADKSGKIALHYAILADAVPTITYLLEVCPEAVFVTTGHSGKTMLMYAAERGNVQVLEAILSARSKVPKRKKLYNGIAGFFGYSYEQRTENELQFIAEVAGTTDTALSYAVDNGRYPFALELVRKGCQVYDGYSLLVDACQREDEEMIRVLLFDRQVPVTYADAVKNPKNMSWPTGSRIRESTRCYATNKSGSMNFNILHAACFKPKALAIVLEATSLSVHNPRPGVSEESPLLLTLQEYVKVSTPRPRPTTNPIQSFANWLFSAFQTPAERTRNRERDEADRHETGATNTAECEKIMQCLFLMIRHRPSEVRLQELRVKQFPSFFHYLWSMRETPVSLWETCLRNEVDTHGLILNSSNNSNVASDFSVAMLTALCQGEKVDILTQLFDAFHVPVNVVLNAATNTTLLHHAVSVGKVSVVSLLLAKNANIQAVDDQGRQPLHLARQVSVAKVLIERGHADVHALDRDRRTPLHYASMSEKDLPLLEYYLNAKTGRRVYGRQRAWWGTYVRWMYGNTSFSTTDTSTSVRSTSASAVNYYFDEDVYEMRDHKGLTPFMHASYAGPSLKKVFENDQKQKNAAFGAVVLGTVLPVVAWILLFSPVQIVSFLYWMWTTLLPVTRLIASVVSMSLSALISVIVFLGMKEHNKRRGGAVAPVCLVVSFLLFLALMRVSNGVVGYLLY